MHADLFDIPIEIDPAHVAESEDEIRRQVEEYAAGDRREFDLSIRFPDGFTGEVMRAMCEIPYGEVRSYGEIAERLDTAAVAVGQACGRNPVPIVVPCHRVVAADGLGGYSGGGDRGLDLKRGLLDLEARGTCG